MDARETRYACGRLRFPLVGEERSMLERRDGPCDVCARRYLRCPIEVCGQKVSERGQRGRKVDGWVVCGCVSACDHSCRFFLARACRGAVERSSL
jgi:hypothetical protein